MLPDDAGTLRLDAEVVHVVPACTAKDARVESGFAVQFGELTPERRANPEPAKECDRFALYSVAKQ